MLALQSYQLYGIRGFKKDRFAMLKEHLKVLELTMWIPRYLTSLTHGIIWPDKLTTLAHETS